MDGQNSVPYDLRLNLQGVIKSKQFSIWGRMVSLLSESPNGSLPAYWRFFEMPELRLRACDLILDEIHLHGKS